MNDTTDTRRKGDLLPPVIEAIPRIDAVLVLVDHPGMMLDWMAVKDHIRRLTERLAEREADGSASVAIVSPISMEELQWAEDHHLTMLDWRAKYDEIAGRIEATIARWEAAGRGGQVGGYLHCADQLRRSVAAEDPQWSPAEIDRIIASGPAPHQIRRIPPVVAQVVRAAEEEIEGWPEGDLVERAVRGAKGRRYPNDQPLWSAVKDTFVCGSQAAMNICRHYGLDPDSIVRAHGDFAAGDDNGD